MKVHKDSGWRCLVAHYDAEGQIKPPCIRCESCGQYIRPEDMHKPCIAKNEPELENSLDIKK